MTDSEKLDVIRSYISSSIDNKDYYEELENPDDWLDINSYAGGNIDDAFYMGKTQGEGDMARAILSIIEDK